MSTISDIILQKQHIDGFSDVLLSLCRHFHKRSSQLTSQTVSFLIGYLSFAQSQVYFIPQYHHICIIDKPVSFDVFEALSDEVKAFSVVDIVDYNEAVGFLEVGFSLPPLRNASI